MPDQKLRVEAQNVIHCYNWMKKFLAEDFETEMCEIAIIVLDNQSKASEPVAFSDVAACLSVSTNPDIEFREFNRKTMMAVIGWNYLDNENPFE